LRCNGEEGHSLKIECHRGIMTNIGKDSFSNRLSSHPKTRG